MKACIGPSGSYKISNNREGPYKNFFYYWADMSPHRSHTEFPKEGSKVCQILVKPSKSCQSGEILPNLIRSLVIGNSFFILEPDFVSSLEDDRHVFFFFRESAVEYMNCGKVRVWTDGNIFIKYLTIYNNENLPNG